MNFVLPLDWFTTFAAAVYDICYGLYSFVFIYKPLIGGGGRIEWINPFSDSFESLVLPSFGWLGSLIREFVELLGGNVNVTFFEMLSGSFVFFVFVYILVKFAKR